MSKLTATIQAFLGNAEAAVSLLGDALCSAVVTMAQHGTRAPMDDAIALIDSLKGRTIKEKAVRAGLASVIADIRAIKVGTTGKDDASALGALVSARFVADAVELMTAPKVTYAKPAPSDVAARAVKALGALTDVQLLAMLKTAEGADMASRIARVAEVDASIQAGKHAEAAARRAKAAAADALEKAGATEAAPVLQAA